VHVDVFEASRNGMMCLSVQDDGIGMDRNRLLCMLSFGFSSKEYSAGNVGRFGIGFKSGSMRLAKDALILTKRDGYAHAALLSQSFLDDIEADDILIPMFSWKIEQGAEGKPCYVADAPSNALKWQENMRAIEAHTFVRSEKELLQEVSKIRGSHGTRIVLFNLRANELDFTGFKNDIRIAGMSAEDADDIEGAVGNRRRAATGGPVFQQTREGQLATTDVPEDYSLRSYMEILYLRPRCKFTLRGTPIKSRDPIAHLKQDYYVFPEYRPRGARGGIILHMGYAEEPSKLCGFHIYNKNRLIKMYQRFGAQLQANTMMKDMLGVVEADALEPTHNKQAFKEADISYMKFKRHLTQSMNDYYFGIQKVRQAGKGCAGKRKYPRIKRRSENIQKYTRESDSDESDHQHMEVLPRRNAPTRSRGQNGGSRAMRVPLVSGVFAKYTNTSRRIKSIHRSLMVHKSAFVFLTPVDPVYLEIPDYFDVIKNPMDLGTIQARLDKDYYVDEDPDAYAADIRLVFANAMTYNKEGDVVYKMARTMSKFFENEWETRMNVNSFSSSDEEENEPLKNARDVRNRDQSRKSKRRATGPNEDDDSAVPEASAALITLDNVPHPLKCVLDEAFFKVVEETIRKLENDLREERAKNAVPAPRDTADASIPSTASQETHHSRMFNALVAEKGELKEQVEKLERQLSLSRANQKELESVKQRLETAMQSQWKRYSEMKVELTEANATVTALRNALPRRISAAPSDI